VFVPINHSNVSRIYGIKRCSSTAEGSGEILFNKSRKCIGKFIILLVCTDGGLYFQITAGCEEGIFLALNCLLSAGDHVVIQTPAYQSLIEIPISIGCDVSEWEVSHEEKWKLKIDALKSLIKVHYILKVNTS
jgi:hypothetical protein